MLKQPAIYVFLFLNIFTGPLQAGYYDLRFEQIGLEEGLSQSTVTCILQDNQGFLWFGTQDGLNKYDGYTIKTYYHDPDNISLQNNFINCMVQDTSGAVWLGTQTGLDRYDPVHDHFTSFKCDSIHKKNIDRININTLFCESSGYLWIGTNTGLFRLHLNSGEVRHFLHDAANPYSICDNRIKTIVSDQNNQLWIGTGNGLNRFNPKSGQFYRYPLKFGYPPNPGDDDIYSLNFDRQNRLWIGTSHGVFVLYPVTGKIKTYQHNPYSEFSLSSNAVHEVFVDSRNTIWIGTGKGLNEYVPSTDSFVRHLHNPKYHSSLSHNSIQSVYEDAGGILWFGTFSAGVNKCDLSTRRFHHLQNNTDNPYSLNCNHIYSIFEDSKKNIWIGTLDGGLNKLEPGSDRFIHFQHRPDDIHSLSDNNLRAITEDRDGFIWVGTFTGHLDRLNPETGQCEHFFKNEPNSKPVRIRSLYADRRNHLWIGTYHGGLYRMNLTTGQLSRHESANAPRGIIRTFFRDSKDNLWIASSDGFYRYLPDSDDFFLYRHEKNDTNSISTHATNYIMEYSDGSLWIGTFAGLNKLNAETGTFTRYRKKDGLPNDAVYGIFEDGKGRLWMSTNYGLSRFDPAAEEFINYNTKDGLQGSEFNAGAHWQGQDGRLWFGGMNGVNFFYPDSIQENPYMPPVVITDFLLFNQSVSVNDSSILKRHINETDEITLHHQDFIFSFEFSSLNFRQSSKNQYQYRLEGFDRDWRKTDYLRRRATYTNLPFGEYIFHVKASNNDGLWNETGKQIKVTILPPFWKTLWFRILVFGIILSVIALIILWRFLDLRNRNIQLSHLVAERTRELELSVKDLKISNAEKDRFFNIIAHDLRSPFTTINSYVTLMTEHIESFTKKEITNFTKELKKNSDATFKLLENLLSWARSQTGSIRYHPESMNLKSLVSMSISPLVTTASLKNIEIKTELSESIYVKADTEMISTVIRNLVSNALKFTNKGGRIIISAEPNHEQVKIKVRDTGIGMSREILEKLYKIDAKVSRPGTDGEAGSGIGLILCNEFLEKHESKLNVESKPDEGSTFYFTLSRTSNT